MRRKVPFRGNFALLFSLARGAILKGMPSPQRTKRRSSPFVANRLWIHRKKMGYTQREVATLLGYRSATHISDYERGKRLPSLEAAIRLEVVLCAPVAFLFPDIRRQAIEEVRRARRHLESHQHEA